MKQNLIPLVVAMLLASAAPAVAADCYADYKAKQDSPLRLHYGVIELSGACTPAAARNEAASRLASGGWTLLNIISVFGPDGLDERRENAGANFLRY